MPQGEERPQGGGEKMKTLSPEPHEVADLNVSAEIVFAQLQMLILVLCLDALGADVLGALLRSRRGRATIEKSKVESKSSWLQLRAKRRSSTTSSIFLHHKPTIRDTSSTLFTTLNLP